jgi:kynurenine 3-monooxygenase
VKPDSLEGRKPEVTIVGAGLTGPLLASYLGSRGMNVHLFERRPDIRKTDIPAGRSINLALSKRGLHALKEIGLADKVYDNVIPMKGRLIHQINGTLDFQPYGKDEWEVIYSVSRAELNRFLLDKAESFGTVSISFQFKCTDVQFSSKQISIAEDNSENLKTYSYRTLIGADGSGSSVRSAMEKQGIVSTTLDPLGHGYKELSIPPEASGDFALDPNALHIWPRKSYMLIALPNADKSFTCTLFLSKNGNPGFDSVTDSEAASEWFASAFPDAVSLMPAFLEDWEENPVGELGTVRCSPWNADSSALLIGDAAHAIVPFFGQGMNAAFEDCTILNDLMQNGHSIGKAIAAFTDIRKADADAIADMALENFIEMRDKVADPEYVKFREMEKRLESEFPEKFIPRYSMVSFNRIPYSEVQKKGKIQQEIIGLIAERATNDIDLEFAKNLINERL